MTLPANESVAPEPTVVDETAYDASLVTARQHGGTVRLVLSAGLPDLDFVEPGSWGRDEESALAVLDAVAEHVSTLIKPL